jgi:hypothetical protein
MSQTEEVQHYADAIMTMIKEDQDTGQVPRGVCSWDELDASVDCADYYREAQLPSGSREATALRHAVSDEVSRRLAGSPDSPGKKEAEPHELREDIEVLAHVHLRKEQVNLEHALQAISDWVGSGTREGANFLITRLTGPIGAGSFFGGADISQFTPTGVRGSLHSQGGTAYHLEFGGGRPVQFPLEARVDLNSGEVTLRWMPPGQPSRSATFGLAYVQKLAPPHGPIYFFDTERTTDEAVYSFTVVLL